MMIPDLPADDQRNDLRARVMFALGFGALALLALMLPHAASDEFGETPLYDAVLPRLLLLVWLLILAEGLYGFVQATDRPRPAIWRLLLVAILPPFRMTIAPHRANAWVWMPSKGWQETGRPALAAMEQRLALTMILATTLILPVLAAEFLFSDAVEASPALQVGLHLMTGLIWLSFAIEFILLVSLAPKKLDFCKRHWINIVIILLPLLAFLRALNLFRFLRAAQAGKMVRVYRLRGLVARSMRFALAYNLIDRLMALNPEGHVRSLEEKITDKEEELEELRARLTEAQARLKERA